MPELKVKEPSLVLVAHCATALAQMKASSPGVLSATVATADGLSVASTLASGPEVDKLAAMSASITALATALAHEVNHGEPQRLVLESSQGHIVSLKVPAPHAGLVLTVVADSKTVLGKLLWDCGSTAAQIAAGPP